MQTSNTTRQKKNHPGRYILPGTVFLLYTFFLNAQSLQQIDKGQISKILLTSKNIQKLQEKYGHITIAQIQISGLKKTNKQVLMSKCLLKPGQKFSEFNLAAAKSTIKDIKIFYDSKIFLTIVKNKDKVQLTLNIHLFEKITLIPFTILKSKKFFPRASNTWYDINCRLVNGAG